MDPSSETWRQLLSLYLFFPIWLKYREECYYFLTTWFSLHRYRCDISSVSSYLYKGPTASTTAVRLGYIYEGWKANFLKMLKLRE